MAVIPKCFVQMEQYCARLSQAYNLSKAAHNSEIAAPYFEEYFKCVLTYVFPINLTAFLRLLKLFIES